MHLLIKLFAKHNRIKYKIPLPSRRAQRAVAGTKPLCGALGKGFSKSGQQKAALPKKHPLGAVTNEWHFNM